MAASADHLYPGKEEIRVIQSEIVALENEVADAQKVIEQAQLRIDELTRQLNERKSQIAPVKKAGFDVLSSIFERCSEIDWKSPLTIATVSHRWREVILILPEHGALSTSQAFVRRAFMLTSREVVNAASTHHSMTPVIFGLSHQ